MVVTKKVFLSASLVCTIAFVFLSPGVPAVTNTYLHPVENRLERAYSQEENFLFSVSWLGFHAGDLLMRVIPDPDNSERFTIKVKVKSSSFFSIFYPIDDYFETTVEGKARLPVKYLFLQKEGDRENRKVTFYDQQNLSVVYQKNEEEPLAFDIDSPVHNEYSSFFMLRVLPLAMEEPVIVPTFADKKTHAVPVSLLKKDTIKSIFGRVPTIKVQPQLAFKGLYSKRGFPDIWLTDDDYRVPVLIKAKILIGSLSARLVEYQGPKAVPPETDQGYR